MKPMTPIIPGLNLRVTMIAENQEEYNNLPAFVDSAGIVLTRWKLSIIERLSVLMYGNIYHTQYTFNVKMQPIFIQVMPPIVERIYETKK